MNSDSQVLMEVKNLCKFYPVGNHRLDVVRSIDLTICAADAISIVGASGAGKSTLLHLLGTLDRPSSGKILFKGQDLAVADDEQLAKFRGEHIGFVFQFHHLLPEFSAVENVMMPCSIRGMSKSQARSKAENLLKLLGMSERKDHFPTQLSGGEQQRVAIARAIVNQPKILFADEPTGNLDSQNSQSMQNLFFDLREQFGVTLVVVTHDRTYASRFQTQLCMTDGMLAPL